MIQESVIFTATLPDRLFITTNGRNCVRLTKHPLRAHICLTGKWPKHSHGYSKTAIIFRFFSTSLYVWMTSTLRNLNEAAGEGQTSLMVMQTNELKVNSKL